MSDDIRQGGAHEPDDLSDVEQLLRELDNEDLQFVAPPPDVWEGIDRAIRSEPGAVVRLRRQRSLTRSWLIAAAVIVAFAAAAVVVAVRRDGEEPVVATALLTHDAATFDPRGAGATATARLLERDGRYEIQLADTDLPAVAGDDLELWLIEPDASGNPKDVAPVSLIDGSRSGVYSVPAGLDPSSHYVVDISIEPRDGDATHSGHSILRGALAPA